MILSSLILIPLVTVIILLFTPSKNELPKWVAFIGASVTGVQSLLMLRNFNSASGEFQMAEKYSWISDLGISWNLGVDGISLFLVVLTGIIFPIAIIANKVEHDQKSFFILIMILMAGSMGAFLALDLLLFFLFFEVVLVPMYFLIGGWGHGNRIYAAMKFFLYTMAASALMLVGIVSLAVLSAAGSQITFDITEIVQTNNLSDTQSLLIFLTFALAFLAKVPAFPLHTWLPDAHTEAPTAGSVILAGVMLKLGTYGLIRFGLYLFGDVSYSLAPIFLTLGVIGIVYGAAVATMQKDLKRLVAYSSVAHMGFIVLGIFSFNTQGLQGSVIQMVNHGISTGALFILVGWVYERRHTRQIAELSGLQKSAPKMTAVFTLVMLSSVGLPGLNGFVGEFLILLGAFSSARWWAVVAVSGVILAALYLLWAYQRSFHGKAEGENLDMPDLKISEMLSIAPLLILIVLMGIFPNYVLERIEPSVVTLIDQIETSNDGEFISTEPEAPAERAGVAGLIELNEAAHSSESDHSADEPVEVE